MTSRLRHPCVRVRLLALCLLVMSPVAGSTLAAQRDRRPESDDDRAAAKHALECRVAAKVVMLGAPAAALAEAHAFLSGCNEQAPAALSAEIRRLAGSRDTAALRPALRGALYVRDTGVFNSAMQVAGRASASKEARAVMLLVAAIELTDLVDFDLPRLMSATEWQPCTSLMHDHSLRNSGGVPLDAGAAGRLRTLVRSIIATPSAPLLVSNAANCAQVVTGP